MTQGKDAAMRMISDHLAAAALGALLATLPLAGVAGPIADQAAAIEASLAEGKPAAALSATQGLFGLVWDQVGTIAFSKVALVSDTASGYGIYSERADATYKLDEPIIIYAEPYGFGYGAQADGSWRIGFNVDLTVLDPAGAVLIEAADLMQLGLVSRYQNKEFQANLTYNLTGMEAGTYVLRTTLRDQNSDRSGSFDLTVEMVP